jgi:hypothetical protein
VALITGTTDNAIGCAIMMEAAHPGSLGETATDYSRRFGAAKKRALGCIT